MKKFISIEEKADRYDKAIEKAKELLSKCKCDRDRITMIYRAEDIKSIFPGLGKPENENEEIRKWLIGYFQEYKRMGLEEYSNGLKVDNIINWLEKQREQKSVWHREDEQNLNACLSYLPDESFRRWLKDVIYTKYDKPTNKVEPKDYGSIDPHFGKPTDKIEPKFRIGDWVVEPREEEPDGLWHIDRIENGCYWSDKCGCTIEYADKNFHLWTIKDAKEGDVLSYETDEGDLWIMIYWSLYKPYEGHVHYHALLVNDDFYDKGTCCIDIDNLKPAIQEQRDLLFLRMEEAGYKWVKNVKVLIKYGK